MHEPTAGRSAASALRPALAAVAASAAAWSILFTALPPAVQDFPLDDDWAFARGAFAFAADGTVDYAHWAAMPQLGQWLWAAPFVRLLGAHFVTLRLSTVVLSWLGLLAFADLLRSEGLSPWRTGLATAALAFNPLFFLLQGTFMTDVPALSFSLIALAFYARAAGGARGVLLARAASGPRRPEGGLRHAPTTPAQSASEGLCNSDARGRLAYLLPATLVALLAVATRQNTAMVCLVAALLFLRTPCVIDKAVGLVAVAVPALAAVGVQYWFRQRDDILVPKPDLPPPHVLVFFPFLAAHLLGLTSLPVLTPGARQLPRRAFIFVLTAMLLSALYWGHWGSLNEYLPFGGLFPYLTNLLTPFGAYQFVYPGDRPIVLGEKTRLLLTVAGCVGGAALLVRLGGRLRHGILHSPLLLFSLFQVPLILLLPLFDRYLLFLVPGALLVAALGPPESRVDRWTALALLVLLAASSIALMHDWLAWNSARWALGHRAMDVHHIRAQDIEGGFEWDGWYTERGGPARTDAPRLSIPVYYQWFPEISGRYALSFSPLADADVLDREPYRLWLLPGQRWFYLLRARE